MQPKSLCVLSCPLLYLALLKVVTHSGMGRKSGLSMSPNKSAMQTLESPVEVFRKPITPCALQCLQVEQVLHLVAVLDEGMMFVV